MRPSRGHAAGRRLAPSPSDAQLELIDALETVSSSISSAHDVDEVTAVIVDAAKRVTHAEKVAICLVDGLADGLALDDSTLLVRGQRDTHPQEWWGGRLSRIVEDVFREGRVSCHVDHDQGAWLLAVPVRTLNEPLGVLVVINSVDHRLQPEHSAFLSILGALAAVSIAKARLAEESRYAIMASERERIAREMHDGISQSLFSISLGMELATKQVPKDPVQAMNTLEDLKGQLSVSAGEIRRLVYDLRPMKLQELGLVGSIEQWVTEATRGTSMAGTVDVVGTARALSPSQEWALYRVAKEAVSNAVRHSEGTAVDVRVDYTGEDVVLTVTNDGRGLEESQTAPHLSGPGAGMRNMRQRMDAEGGRLDVASGPVGVVVRAQLPIGEA